MTEDLITAGTSHRSPREVGGADAVVVEGLTKRYGGRAAVDNLSFAIPIGTVAGLIGPNGAGKTTLMAMLLGLVRPTSGTGTVLGEPLGKTAGYLNRVGALIESPAFHPAVSGIDNLRSLAVLGSRSQTNIPDLIELVGLAGRGHDRVGSYSMGYETALRHRRRAARRPRTDHPRRADQRPRSRWHAGRPSLDRLPAEQSIQAMQAFNKDAPNAWFMTFMFGTACLCVWLAITAIRRHGRPGSIYLVLGAALYLVAVAVTAIYHVPVNDGIDKVVPSTPDAAKEWADFAPGWNAWNHVRTITSIAACALFLLSVRVQRPIHRSS